jgi:hypothetical protein
MITQTNTSGTQRRDFLKVMGAGLASAWALSASSNPLTNWFLLPSLAAQTSFNSGLLRGTQDGKVLQSLDQGQTWQTLASFGAHCAISALVTRDGQLYAKLAVDGHSFWLYTADTKTWRTLG